MKKTEKIHIAGIAFQIDEDAYQALKRYLSSIYSRFHGTEEGTEIIRDVEGRIAELLQEALKTKDVITMDDVNHVIEVLGDPEDFEEATEEAASYEKEEHARSRTYKRLYRDPERAVAAGVCSGLGGYFNIEPVIIRLLFIILFLLSIGAALIVYILLWIMIPRASTTAQKLEMRGERVDVSGIERRIKEEFYSVRDNVSRLSRSENYNKFVHFLNEIGNGLYRLVRFTLKLLGYVLGALLLLVGLVAVISVVVSFLAAFNLYIPDFVYQLVPNVEASTFFINVFSSTELLLVGLLLVVGVPLVLLLYLGLRIVFKLRDNGRAVGLTALALWLVGIGITLFSGLRMYGNFSNEGQTSERMELQQTKASAWHIKIDETKAAYADFDDTELELDDHYLYWADDEHQLRIRPKISVKPGFNKEPEIVLRKQARGKNREQAATNARQIAYNWHQKDSLLVLSPYFAFDQPRQWRFHSMEIIVRLPVDSHVYLNENLYYSLDYTPNLEDMWTSEMPGKLWKVKSEGLALAHQRKDITIDSSQVDDKDIERMKEELEKSK